MTDITLTGTLRYERLRDREHSNLHLRTFRNRTLVVMIKPGQLAEYYEAMWKKQVGTGARIFSPRFGYHVTIVSGKETIPNPEAWQRYEGEKVSLTYSVESLRRFSHFWMFDVDFPRGNEIRVELGMKPIDHLHLTIGRVDVHELNQRFALSRSELNARRKLLVEDIREHARK